MTAESRIQQVSEHLIRAITEDPTADYELLEDATCGLVTKDATEGNGLDIAKRYYRSLRNLMGDGETAIPVIQAPTTPTRGRKPEPKVVKRKVATKTTTKKRGRPTGTKNKTTTTTKATAKPKPAVASKKRGRPKGSKNKPKNVEQTTTK